MASFAASLGSEWLKTKRSLMLPLTMGTAFFIPSIILFVRLVRPGSLAQVYAAPDFWQRHWNASWEAMALMLLPLSIALLVSLVVQIEYRNNTWKQLHATPQALGTIFAAKLTVIVAVVVQLFAWFLLAIYVTAMVPPLLFAHVDAPAGGFPAAHFLRRTLSLFADVLPIVALQYALALRFRSFVVPLGVAIALWILALGALGWQFNYLIPYGYAAIDYTTEVPSRVSHQLPLSAPLLGLATFAALVIVGHADYTGKADRG
jgi:hypothetical protein